MIPAITNATMYIDERILLNKAILDASVDVPTIMNTNNHTERHERFNRAGIGWVLAFASPYLVIPLANRFAMKHIAKLTKSYSYKADPMNKLIKISNRYLHKGADIESAAKEIMKDTNVSEFFKSRGGAEKVRHKLVNAKNSVLAFDLTFTTGMVGSVGFFNNWRTKKKTGREGFSAEFGYAGKEVTDRRAEKFKQREWLRKTIFYSFVGLLTLLPIAVRKGLNSNSNNFIKKHAHLLDYDDGILMKRLPFFLTACGFYLGVGLASRNETEVRDNLLRSAVGMVAFFGGDQVIGAGLGKASDHFFKTEMLKKVSEKTWLEKIVPPVKKIKDMDARSKKFGVGAFWLNLAMLSAICGFGMPYILNKIIKKDVDKDTAAQDFLLYNDVHGKNLRARLQN